MRRIYADFNYRDEKQRVVLNTTGALRDIATAPEELVPGLRVLLYMSGEFEVEGVLEFDGVWLAKPDYSTIRYYDDREGG